MFDKTSENSGPGRDFVDRLELPWNTSLRFFRLADLDTKAEEESGGDAGQVEVIQLNLSHGLEQMEVKLHVKGVLGEESVSLLAKLAEDGLLGLSHVSIESEDISCDGFGDFFCRFGADIETINIRGSSSTYNRFSLDNLIVCCPKLRELDVSYWPESEELVFTAIFRKLPTTLKLSDCSKVRHHNLTLAILGYPNFSSLKVLEVVDDWSEEDCLVVKVRSIQVLNLPPLPL